MVWDESIKSVDTTQHRPMSMSHLRTWLVSVLNAFGNSYPIFVLLVQSSPNHMIIPTLKYSLDPKSNFYQCTCPTYLTDKAVWVPVLLQGLHPEVSSTDDLVATGTDHSKLFRVARCRWWESDPVQQTTLHIRIHNSKSHGSHARTIGNFQYSLQRCGLCRLHTT